MPRVPGSSPASATLRRAFAALKLGKLAEAEAGFQEAIRLDPKRVEGLIGLAEVSRERRQPAQAELWLKRAVALNDSSPLVYRSLGHYFAGINRIDEAEGAFRKAAALDISSPDALVEMGDMELTAGKMEMATQAYREAVARRPGSYDAHMGLGTALAGGNHLEEAVSQFRQAASLDPLKAAPLLSLGLAYGAEGDRNKAIEALGAALKIDGRFVQAWISRGDAYQAKGDSAKAISDYSQALKIDPKAGIAQFKIGLVHLAANRAAEAERSFHAAVDLDPNLAHAWNNLAWMAADKKSNLDLALVWAKKAVSIAPREPEFADTLAWVYRARRELDLAARTIEKFPGRDRSPVLLYHLGLIDSERGRKREAAAALRQALSAGAFAEADQARKLLKSLGP